MSWSPPWLTPPSRLTSTYHGDRFSRGPFESMQVPPRRSTPEVSDGAWLDYRSGHRAFVPASSFIGGR